MKRLLAVLLAFSAIAGALADPPTVPAWFPNPNPLTQPDPSANYVPANLGQLKHMATLAKAHLDATLVGGAGYAVNSMVARFGPDDGIAYTQAEKEENYRPVNLGQLKAVAQPFYARLKAAGVDTKGDITTRLSRVWSTPVSWGYDVPWNPSTARGENYAPANIGQLKFVFAFDLTHFDDDQDGLGNAWELAQFGNLSRDGSGDLDGDGVPDRNEFLYGGDPHSSDGDGDGDSDLQEITAGTNPADANDLTPRRIGYFPMDSVSSGTPTFLDVNGQAPTSKAGVEQVAGRKGKAARLNDIGDLLSYPKLRADGSPNIALKRGTVRFWFRPEWPSSGTPGNYARFIQLGQYSSNHSIALWMLMFQPENHKVLYSLKSGTNTASYNDAHYGLGNNSGLGGNGWLANTWHQFTFTYSPSVRKLYIDGVLMATVASSPIADFRLSDFDATGIMIGSDGAQPLKGAIDEVEFFNYELTQAQIEADYGEEVALGVDANGNGLPDAWDLLYFNGNTQKIGAHDDYDSDGLTNYQEWKLGTNPADVDSDYDGCSDGAEVADRRNPLDGASTKPIRLGYFPMSTTSFLSSVGGIPLRKGASATVAAGRVGKGLDFYYLGGTDPVVRYRDVEVTGKPSINYLKGSIRLWFKPYWSSNSSGTPSTSSPLIACGVRTTGATDHYWALTIEPGGGTMKFLMQDANGNTIERLSEALVRSPESPMGFEYNKWYEIVLVYGPSASKLYINGVLRKTGSGSTIYPSAPVRSLGFSVGTDRAGNDRVWGTVDEVETFNYELTQAQIEANYAKQLALGVDSDSDGLSDTWEILKFGDLDEIAAGDPDHDGWTNRDEWLRNTNPNSPDRTANTWSTRPDGVTVGEDFSGNSTVTWTPTPSGDVTVQSSKDGINWDTEGFGSGSSGTITVPSLDPDSPTLYRVGSPGAWSQLAASDPFGDADGDGLSNAEEAHAGTNPGAEDSDGDGVGDGLDGWARASGLHPPRLPEVGYVVLDTTIPEESGIRINAKAEVLVSGLEKGTLFSEGKPITVPKLTRIAGLSDDGLVAGVVERPELDVLLSVENGGVGQKLVKTQRAAWSRATDVVEGEVEWFEINDALRYSYSESIKLNNSSTIAYVTPGGLIIGSTNVDSFYNKDYLNHPGFSYEWDNVNSVNIYSKRNLKTVESPFLLRWKKSIDTYFNIPIIDFSVTPEHGESIWYVNAANDYGIFCGGSVHWQKNDFEYPVLYGTSKSSVLDNGLLTEFDDFNPSAVSNSWDTWLVGFNSSKMEVRTRQMQWNRAFPTNGGEISAEAISKVNGRGEIVGSFTDENGQHGQLIRNQQVVDLNAKDLGWEISRIADINETGVMAGVAKKTRDDAGNPIAGSDKNAVMLVPCELVPDHNRDGKIDDKDRGKVTKEKPFRWWLNDDDDNGDLGHEDRPLGIGSSNADAALGSTHIDGTCDLIDWFPVFLDLKKVLEVLPPGQCQYFLKQADAALNVVYTDLKPEQAGDYLRDGETADELKDARSYVVFANGSTQITTEFLNKIKNDGKGVILLEGGNITEKPLYVEIYKDGKKVADVSLELKIDSVEKMYRWINIRAAAGQSIGRATDTSEPTNYPDKETNKKMFIFIHGYNVSEQQSRGWFAEGFKRLYQTGSNAMFTGVSWHGDSSQLPVIGYAPDFWENVDNSFKSSAALAAAVNSLPGSTKISAAHSLGNMMVSSAIKDHGMSVSKHFLFDAAVPIEAYDPTALSITLMRNPDWAPYAYSGIPNPFRLWATEWHKLFDGSDGRSKLTWRNRFGALTVAYNFYSSGEDVLNNPVGQMPPIAAERAWALQEMVKGTNHIGAVSTLDSNGGWGFNDAWDIEETIESAEGNVTVDRRRTPAEAGELTDEQLKTQPFFKRFQDSRLMDANQGSAAANEYPTRAKTLSDAIPSLSFAVGRNPVPAFGGTRNVDLMTQKNDDGAWPQARLDDSTKVTSTGEGRWVHGDAKDVAYRYNYLLWMSWVDLGGLK